MNLLAILAGVAGLCSALGYAAYLVKLGSAAERRSGGAPVKEYVGTRLPIACVALAMSVLALLLVTGPSFADVLSICVGAGAAIVALGALQQTRDRYGSYT